MKRNLNLTGCLLLAGLTLAAAEVLNPPRLEAPSLIDGNLSEACWEKALKTGPFKKLGGGNVKEKTEGFLFVDKENFYIGMKCYFANFEAKSKEIAGAKNPFSIDVAEIFLDPGATGNYQHIAVNAAGMLYFPGKQAEIKCGVQVNSDYWSLEAKIPFTSIKVSGEKFSKEWGINLARGNSGAKESVTWAPLMNGTFHEASRFFLISGININLVQLGRQQAVANAGDFEIALDRILYDRQKEIRTVLDIKYTKSMKGFRVNAEVFDRNGKSVLNKTVKPVFFKNEFTLPVENLKNGRYKLVLQLNDASGKILKSGEKSFWKIPPKTSKQKNVLTIKDHNLYLNGNFFFPVFSFAYGGLKEKEKMTREPYLAFITDYYKGDYRDLSYNCVYSSHLDISSETDFDYLKKNGGLNSWDYKEWQRRQKHKITTEDMINARAAAGVYSIPEPYYLKCHTKISDEMIDRWVSMMLKLRDMENIIMWSMADETDAEIEGNKLRYQLYKEMDPDRPAWLNVINGVAQNKDSADVLSTDPYPIPNSKVTMVSANADRLVRTYKDNPNKSYMLVLQIFGEGAGRMYSRPPTPQEMEVMAFLAMNHGTKGIGWWVFQPKELRVQPYQHPDTFERQKIVHRRIKELAPAYCLGKKTMMEMQNKIDVAVLKYKGKTYISCANTVNEPVTAELSIPDKVTLDAQLKYGKQKVRIANGVLRDSFQPYEVRIYEF